MAVVVTVGWVSWLFTVLTMAVLTVGSTLYSVDV